MYHNISPLFRGHTPFIHSQASSSHNLLISRNITSKISHVLCSGQLVVVIANLHRELRKKRGLFLVTIFLAIIAYSIPQTI